MLSGGFVEGAFYAICQRQPTNCEIAGIMSHAANRQEAIHAIRRMPEAAKFFNGFYSLSFNWINLSLAIGEYPSPFQSDLLVEDGINEFVNLTGVVMPYVETLPADVGYREFSLKNDTYNGSDIVVPAVRHVLEKISDHRRVYLHCYSGISRSAMVAALVVAVESGRNYKDALQMVTSQRAMARPHPDLLTLQEAASVIKAVQSE